MRNVLVAVVVALATATHALVWLALHEQVSPPNASGVLSSISFSPINPKHDGETDKTSEAQIRSDLAAIAPFTRSVRTYSVGNGLDRVPQLASEVGLRVTLGVWINEWEDQNEREIDSAIALAKQYRNVDSVIVGNEAVFRAQELNRDNPEYAAKETVRNLIAKIQRVKREVRVPVTTAEVPNVWLEHPELASAVDYLAVHILPYWEGIPGSSAVDHALNGYERLRQAYPGKRIVIAEFGWPSAGLNRKAAEPSPITQAQIVRDFVARADAMGIDYSIVEAFDQPWKTNEGSVGPYWGIFDADRNPKFTFAGTVETPNFLLKMMAALAIGLLLSIPIFGIPRATAAQAGVLALTAGAIGAWSANVIDYWVTHYFVLGSQIALFVGAGLLVPLVVIMKRRIEELAAILFGAKGRRLLTQGGGMPEHVPLVSIHIPACREPPEMLRQTLDAVAALNWPNFECVVVINNTPDPAMWAPIEDHCRLLGPRFKFLRADKMQGFKAGALRLALEHTATEAEIIGVLDADYVVHPDWLKDLVPAFADPAVGLVQAPQDHRDASRTITQVTMNREYAGFFDIGMVERNEVNAIVVHGTMCLIRREALVAAGSWSSDTIVEDTDLGLSLLERGWRAHYTQYRYGWGLLPCDFAAYKRQRHRWAYGGVQLIKKHWRAFLPGRSRLTPQQRSQYLFGWLTWLGAESSRCAYRHSQSHLDAARGLSRHCRARGRAHAAGARHLRRDAVAFHGAVPHTGAGADLCLARRGDLGHGVAADRRPGGGRRPDPRPIAVRTHRQGRSLALVASVPGAVGRRARRPAGARRAHAVPHQRATSARDLDLRRGASGAELAVPGGGGAGADRALAAQRVCDLAQAGDHLGLYPAAAARAGADRRTAGRGRHRHRAVGGHQPKSMLRKRSALPTTDTDEKLMAAAAMIGDSRMPKAG